MRIVMRRNYGVTRLGEPWLRAGRTYSTNEMGISREELIMILATRKADVAEDTSANELWNIETATVDIPEVRKPTRRRKKVNE